MTKHEARTVLEAEELTRHFSRPSSKFFLAGRKFAAVDHVSFSMKEGEILGLLGESGCGKSTLARMLMHLIRPDEGKIRLDGTEVQDMPERMFRRYRRDIQMVFQNPFDCLDPSMRIEKLLEEPLLRWEPDLNSEGRKEKIEAMLNACGLPKDCDRKRPGEFSGGQLQRIVIARALLSSPKILIADEIVSALDVSVQAQILEMLNKMRKEYRLSILFITHDLSVACKISDQIMVMKDGKIQDRGTPEGLFSKTQNDYVKALADATFTFSAGAGMNS